MVHRQGKRSGDDKRNASSAETGGKGSKKGSGKGKSKKKIEARFYDNNEWNKLTAEEKDQVIEFKKQKKEKKRRTRARASTRPPQRSVKVRLVMLMTARRRKPLRRLGMNLDVEHTRKQSLRSPRQRELIRQKLRSAT